MHGLICATVDQSTGIAWITGGSTQTTVNGNTSINLGTGQANTNAMKAQVGYTGGAAKVCDDYVNVETGTGVYSDWYLPSKNEIMQMQLNQNAINAGFVFGYYWSSSEHDYNYGLNAWVALFVSDFTVTAATKDNNITKVRAIRSF